MRRGSLSSELQMCDGGARSILLRPLVARCLEIIDVCIWRMFGFTSVVVTVWWYLGSLLCSGVFKDSGFSLRVLKYVLCLCRGCDGCCVFCLDVVYDELNDCAWNLGL